MTTNRTPLPAFAGPLRSVYRAAALRFSALCGNRFFCLAMVLLYQLSVLLFFKARFEVSDDLALLRDVQGGYLTSFMAPLLGRGLSLLYALRPSLPWYPVFLYLVHAAGLCLFVRSLRRIGALRPLFLPLCLLYLSFHAFFLINISYNSTALFIGTVSLFAFLVGRAGGSGPAFLAGTGLLFSLSYLIRMETPAAILLFSLPALALSFFREPARRWRDLALFALPFLLVVGANLLTTGLLMTQEQRRFDEFNRVRGRFHDYAVQTANEGNAALLHANHWSANDYALLNYWLYCDESKFNTVTMENIFRHARPRSFGPGAAAAAVRAVLAAYRLHFLFLLAVLLVIAARSVPSAGRYALCALGWVIACAAAMQLFLRFPPRIGAPLLAGGIATLLTGARYFPRLPSTNGRRGGLLIAAAGLLGALLFLLNLRELPALLLPKGSANFAPDRRLIVHYLNERYAGKTIVAVPTFSSDVFFTEPFRFTDIPLNWTIYSPRFYDQLEKGLGTRRAAQLWERLIDDENAFIVIAFPPALDLIATYYRENHPGRKLLLRKVDAFGKAEIYRLVSRRE